MPKNYNIISHYSNKQSFPLSHYESPTTIVSSGQDSVVCPVMDVDVGGTSLRNASAQTLNINSDSSWDFGQNIGTWTADTEYSVGDWVRPINSNVYSSIPHVSDPLPNPAGGGVIDTCLVYHGSYLYLWGGTGGGNRLYRFHLETETWSEALTTTGTPPVWRYACKAIVYGDFMYIYGGWDGGSTHYQDLHRINLNTLEWSGELSTTGTLPVTSDFYGSCVLGNKWYIFGGRTKTTKVYNHEVCSLNLDTLEWSGPLSLSGATMTNGVGPAAFTYNGLLYRIGGSGGGFYSIDPNTLVCSTVTTSGSAPLNLYYHCVEIVDDYLFMFGGQVSSINNNCYKLNLLTMTWEPIILRGGFIGYAQGDSVYTNGYIYSYRGNGGSGVPVYFRKMNVGAESSYYFRCLSAGQSGAIEPFWTSQSTIDGSITWEAYINGTNKGGRAGTDFYIYACQPESGIAPTLLLSANSTYPDGYTASNSRKIGGFHGLCGSVGTISGHTLSGYLTGDVLPQSVWCLKHRARAASNAGLVYIPPIKKWSAIYLTSGTSSAPTIRFGGTILDTITYFVANDAARLLKMRMPRDSEFAVLAAGSNEGTNILGSADPVTVTAAVDTAGRRMISNYGVEGCVGISLQFLSHTHYRFSAAATHTHNVTVTGDAGSFTSTNSTPSDIAPTRSWKNVTGGKGQLYTQGSLDISVLTVGGYWGYADKCGSLGLFCYYTVTTSASDLVSRFITSTIEK